MFPFLKERFWTEISWKQRPLLASFSHYTRGTFCSLVLDSWWSKTFVAAYILKLLLRTSVYSRYVFNRAPAFNWRCQNFPFGWVPSVALICLDCLLGVYSFFLFPFFAVITYVSWFSWNQFYSPNISVSRATDYQAEGRRFDPRLVRLAHLSALAVHRCVPGSISGDDMVSCVLPYVSLYMVYVIGALQNTLWKVCYFSSLVLRASVFLSCLVSFHSFPQEWLSGWMNAFNPPCCFGLWN